MSDNRALMFVESFVSEFISECRSTLDELSQSNIAAGNKPAVNAKMNDAAKQILIRYIIM